MSAVLAAGIAAPVGCALATSGLESSADATTHEGGVPDARWVDRYGDHVDADASDAPTPPGDDATPLDGPDEAPESDATTVPDASPPCATGVLFCDGFEQGLGAWPQIEQTNGTIGLDTTHVHRGTEAVRAHMDAITQQGGNPAVTIDHQQAWPAHFWMRFFVYAPSPFPPSNGGALLNLIQGSGADPGLQLFLSPGSANVSLTTYNTGNDQTWGSSTTSPLDQWVCFEVEVDVPSETVNIAMNGLDLADVDRTGLTLPSADITKLGLGFFNPSTQGAYDAWFDDVIVDSQPIGCTK